MTAFASPVQSRPDPRASHRLSVNLTGRLMLASQAEHDCKAVEMSADDVMFHCSAFPKVGERVVA